MTETPINFSSAPIQRGQTPQGAQAAFVLAQVESEEAMVGTDDVAFNPVVMAQRNQTLEAKRGKKAGETAKTEKDEQKIEEVHHVETVAGRYQRDNPELQSRTLILLRAGLKKDDSSKEILDKLASIYHDHALVDEALDFLLETADAEMKQALTDAKKEINEQYGREIKAGRNMGAEARAFSTKGLGSPTALRDIYRDITANPRETLSLFDELNSKFEFEKMGTVIDFLLHSLGTDLKAKGPSIARGELHRLVTETRALQAILGVFRFFQSRMRLIQEYLKRHGRAMPLRLNFIALSKQFIKLLQERYPNADKILQLAAEFGLMDDAIAQILLCSQYRDGLRQVAPKLFRGDRHRHDLSMMIALALDKLHKKIEEEEEAKKEQKEKEKEKQDRKNKDQ